MRLELESRDWLEWGKAARSQLWAVALERRLPELLAGVFAFQRHHEPPKIIAATRFGQQRPFFNRWSVFDHFIHIP